MAILSEGTTIGGIDILGNTASAPTETYTSMNDPQIVGKPGMYRIYGTTGVPYAGYSNWNLLVLEAGAQRGSTNKYMIHIALYSNSVSASARDLCYGKAYYNGTSWSFGSWYLIWNQNNDGTTMVNGLDAYLVQGRHGVNNYLHSVVTGASTNASVFNTASLGFAVVNSTANAPDSSCGSWGYLNLPCYSTITATTYIKQIAYPYGGATALRGKVYVRDYSNGTWTAWNEIGYRPSVEDNAGAHNSIFRGKYLGTSVTAAQYSAISSGTFTDLFIGDYWTIGGVNYRIAAFDYYYDTGSTPCTVHHAVIVPDQTFGNAVMNDSDLTNGGYTGSKMFTTNLQTAINTITSAFSEHLLEHSQYLCNAVTNGYPSASVYVDRSVDLMSEHMVYGCNVMAPMNTGETIPHNYRCEKSQLPLFRLAPQYQVAYASEGYSTSYWLRDVVSDSEFAFVDCDGCTCAFGCSYSNGVRPAFTIS